MNQSATLYKRHRFPAAIIQYAVWLYHRFNLSHRDIEDLLAERGIEVSYESLRLWCNKSGPLFSKRLKRNDSWAPMQSSTACSIYNASWYRRRSTGSVGCVRLNVGTKQLQREDGERLLLIRCR